jgi:Ca2+-binding EF-hand superfamily protein
LREYIYYYNIDYEKNCQKKDEFLKGTLTKDQFRNILNKYVYPFTKQELDSLLAMSPKNYEDLIQYKAFFHGIRRLGKPRTHFSLQKMLKNSYEFYEKYKTISSDNFFNLKKIYELRKYELQHLNLKAFSKSGAEDLDNFNNQVIVENFLIKLSRDFFRTIKAVYPNQELTEGLIFKTFGIKPFEKNSFMQP